MPLTVPNVGEVLLLSYAVNLIPSGDLKLHLYTAIASPLDEDTVIGDFTEAILDGDAEPAVLPLDGDLWVVETALGVTTASYPQQEFVFTDASTNLGYYVTDSAGTGLLWAEAFSDAPHVIPSGGGTEKVTLNLEGE